MAVQAHATARYIRTSAQKAGLVMNLIRGRDVNAALATLQFARKSVARDIEKVLRSAIANASQKDGFGGDVERLYVNACYANQGPSQKRIRPAPMGRAYRYVRRISHIEIALAERNRNGNANVATVVGAEQKSAKAPSKAAGKKPAKKKTGGKKKKTAGAR